MTKKDFKQPKCLVLVCFIVIVLCTVGYAAMEKVSANPKFCGSCHNMQSYCDTYTQGDLLAKKHANANVTCHDCHEPSMSQQMDEGFKFVTGNYTDPLPQYKYSNEQCLKCHDFNEVKAKTAKYGKENPHESEHAVGNTEPPQCYTCHSVHHKQSLKACTTCHGLEELKPDSSWEQ